MATQTSSIPPDLTDADKAIIFQGFDAILNSMILYSQLHGAHFHSSDICIYTGIVAVTLWNIFMNKPRPIGQPMAIIITILYIVSIISLAFAWSSLHAMFVDNGQNFWTKYLFINTTHLSLMVGIGVTGAICTILADSIMIWRCWMVWGRRWPVVLLPALLLVSGIVFKILATYKAYTNANVNYILGYELYSSFSLGATLLCTLLIVYRIVTVAQAGAEAGGGLRAYRHIIEVLVESSALYSIFLILYVVFLAHNELVLVYFDILASIARGVAPTLLVGHVAAGHARPDDSWQGGVVSGSLRFREHSDSQSSQQYSTMSEDIEVQQERDDQTSNHTSKDSQEGILDEGAIRGNNVEAEADTGGSSSVEHI
ncbi:hypothetical protein DFS33DRAFT_1451951 [Desarmillaria ectypa]|nr:hypothetical protein DFS33DRAFT_1451951 [Desarmillaria ectypa]